MKNLKTSWDLDSIFPGGSQSPELKEYLENLQKEIGLLDKDIAPGVQDWSEIIEKTQTVAGKLREAASFVNCLNAQNVKDNRAKLLMGRIMQLQAFLNSVLTALDQQMLDMSQEEWQRLLENAAPVAFNLEERREMAREKMGEDKEKLVNDLSVDGYHGWNDLYSTVTGRMKIKITRDGQEKELSIGQAANIFADPDAKLRQTMAEKWEAAWAHEAELCASALNHLSGFRINLYGHRGWDSILKEPLQYNRMSPETLDAMWSTISENKEPFVAYLERKAQLLGLDSMSWCHLRAPVGRINKKFSYDDAANFIVEQFEKVSPIMAEATRRAFKNNWIEAEDRGGKRQGAFCTTLPMSQETRVFMTYSGSAGSVSTLAHELGHAFHQYAMRGLPLLAQRYPMNLAETASTFGEMVVADAALENVSSKEEKIALLADKIDKSISFFMDIHCRYLFELNFYQARKNGPVGVEELNSMMEGAQKESFCNSLTSWHPHFWASKLHFYITAMPFYNFPYTFGYLFSSGVYARAREAGKNFQDQYLDLLRDTGRMRVEELARQHLGVDLTGKDFWQQAVDQAATDVKLFLELTG